MARRYRVDYNREYSRSRARRRQTSKRTGVSLLLIAFVAGSLFLYSKFNGKDVNKDNKVTNEDKTTVVNTYNAGQNNTSGNVSDNTDKTENKPEGKSDDNNSTDEGKVVESGNDIPVDEK